MKTKDGAVSIGGLIGSTNDLGNLKINDDDTGNTGTIALSGIGNSSSDTAGVTGTVDIGHTNTSGIDLSGGYYHINGATVLTTAANDGANPANTDIIDLKQLQPLRQLETI